MNWERVTTYLRRSWAVMSLFFCATTAVEQGIGSNESTLWAALATIFLNMRFSDESIEP